MGPAKSCVIGLALMKIVGIFFVVGTVADCPNSPLRCDGPP